MPDNNVKYTGEDETKAAVIQINDNAVGLSQFNFLNDIVSKEMENGISNFVFDLTMLNSINSSGLGILISCLKKVKDGDGSLKIVNVNDKIMNIFTLTKLDKVFEINVS